jgi:tetratricopeptide (TPR) repeat protein
MTLADERLNKLDSPSLAADAGVVLRCRVAADLMQRGQYEDAREALGGLWCGIGQRPDTQGLDEKTAAEVLLQVGALSGWMGASRQTVGAQEAAKDLIGESAALFERAGERAKTALARSDLALCYWREGAYDEARVLLARTFDEFAEADPEYKAVILLRHVTVECAAGKLHDALTMLKESARELDASENHALRGNFHSLYAVTLRRLGTLEGNGEYFDKAIIEHTAAIYHYEQAHHERYRAYNENNLANLLRKLGHHREAHEHLDRARAIFLRLDDAGLLAQVDETRARVFIAEKRYEEADRAIARAVQTMEKGGGSAILADALTTQGVVWARLGDSEKSVNVLLRAVKMAEEAGALSNAGLAALTLIEEHGAWRTLSQAELYRLYEHADDLLRDTQDAADIERLRACARIVMQRLAGVQFGDENFDLYGAVEELEAKYFEQALEEAGGSVTRAAKLLGIRHQSFIAMLRTRHQRLLSKRRPTGKRRRSIIKESK